jgi:arylsulfatase A-like enzyme
VAVTVTDWFGLDAPEGAMGRSLAEAASGADAPPPLRFAWVVEDDPPAHNDERWAVHSGRLKAVFNVDRGTAKLFDLKTDPGETRDLSAERPEDVRRLREALVAWRSRVPRPEIPFDQVFSPEELERLRSVGYLGGAGG